MYVPLPLPPARNVGFTARCFSSPLFSPLSMVRAVSTVFHYVSPLGNFLGAAPTPNPQGLSLVSSLVLVAPLLFDPFFLPVCYLLETPWIGGLPPPRFFCTSQGHPFPRTGFPPVTFLFFQFPLNSPRIDPLSKRKGPSTC